MRERYITKIAVLFPTLLAVLVAVAMSRLYVAPFVVPDTNSYLNAAAGSSQLGFRTPFYGTLLLWSMALGHPMLMVWLQVLSWIACITMSTLIVLSFTRSVWRSVIVGILMVASEVVTMHLLPAQWFLLTDALYADWLTLGLLLILLSFRHRISWVLLTGTLFIGIANLVRPLMVGLLVATLLVVVTAMIERGYFRRWIIVGLLVLWLPTVTQSWVRGQTMATQEMTPLIGLHQVLYTMALLQPDDRVFTDQNVNDAFHAAVRQRKVLPGFEGANPFFFPKAYSVYPILQFYASRSKEKDLGKLRYAIASQSVGVTRQLILRHPLRYLRLMTGAWMTFIVPTGTGRDVFFWHPQPFDFYNYLTYRSNTGATRERIFSSRELPGLERFDERMASYLDSTVIGIRLPKTVGRKTIILLLMMTVLAIAESIRRMRSEERRLRLLGVVILPCLGSTYLHALAQALVTLQGETRFALPGILTMTLAFLLTLVSLTLPHQRRKQRVI